MAGPEDLTNYGDRANRLLDIMTNLTSKVNTLVGAISGVFGQKSIGEVEQFNNSVGETVSLFDKLKMANTDLQKLVDTQNTLTTATGQLIDPLDTVAKSFANLGQFISNAKIFDKFATESVSAINTVDTSVSGLGEALTHLGIKGKDIAAWKALTDNATQAEKLENNFIALAASTGQLNELFTDGGTKVKDLTALTGAFSDKVHESADATGLSVTQSLEFAAALGKIPGVMDHYIQTGTTADDVVNGLTATMQLMTGTGRSQADVIRGLTTSYENLSQAQGKLADDGQRGAEFLATISSTANTLGVRFEDVRGVLETTAEQFKFVGNETDAAARVLGRYTDALRETGLTSKASIDITGDLIKNMTNLTMGTKAFLSLRSGGPGGLQGGFQIEQLLRQGRLDQVVQMAERSLRQQTGGRIFTQAEAAASPQAAAQFMRQRQLLQSGVFGIGGGLSDEKATRMLEALQKGDVSGVTHDIKTGQDALTQATTRGTDIQSRNNNELKRANNTLQTQAIAMELTAGTLLRIAAGMEGGRAPGLQAAMQGGAAGATFAQERETGMRRGGTGPADRQAEITGLARDALAQWGQIAQELAPTLKDAGEAMVSGATDAASALKGVHQQVETEAIMGRIPAPIPGLPATRGDADHRAAVMRNALGAPPQHTPAIPAQHIAAIRGGGATAPQAQTPEQITRVKIDVSSSPDLKIKVSSDSNSVEVHNSSVFSGASTNPNR